MEGKERLRSGQVGHVAEEVGDALRHHLDEVVAAADVGALGVRGGEYAD